MSSRDKRKQEERKANARRWAVEEEAKDAAARNALGRAFLHVARVRLRGQKVFLAIRVSTPKQKRDLASQILYVKAQAAKAGAHVVGVGVYVANGADPKLPERVYAEAFACGASHVIFESVCRAVRHPNFGRNDLHIPPSLDQLEHLTRIFTECGIRLVTCLPPDADFHTVRSHQAHRGLLLKGSGGRGRRKQRRRGDRRRLSLLYRAVALNAQGYGYGRIAHTLGCKKATVQGWIRRATALPFSYPSLGEPVGKKACVGIA